jgi:hypothetical protein
MQANYRENELAYMPLPGAATQAMQESLISCGFSDSAIVEEYSFFSDEALIKLNALAFAHPSQRDLGDYAGVTVYNAVNGHNDSELVKSLSISSAPFHLIHREDKFSFWVSKATTQQGETHIYPAKKEDSIAYERLGEVFHKYEVDLKPQRIIDVKRGRGAFTFFPDAHPWQLSLWALEVRSKPLVHCFKAAMKALRRHPSQPSGEHARLIAIQILGALVMADSGLLGSYMGLSTRPAYVDLIREAHAKFQHFFQVPLLLAEYPEAAEEAYILLGSINYAGFVPEMLGDLYVAAYPREERKDLENHDTPLYLTRRIWDTIPVEFLPPQERVTVDMTCGLGSFLISGYERFSQLTDAPEMNLPKCLYGNAPDSFFAQLTRLGLLHTTSRDDWEIGQTDAFEWEWLQKRQANIIIGTPPFGRDEPESEDDESEESKKPKGSQKAYKFLEYALTCLKPGGYLAMIMPRSFTVAPSGSELRQKLLESCDIFELWDIPQQVFKGQNAASPTTVIFLQKNKEGSERSHHCVRVRTIQPATLKVFENTGIYTASNLVADQARWRGTVWQSGARARSEHVIDYPTILSEAQWRSISDHCLSLGACSKHVRGVKIGQKDMMATNKDLWWFPGSGKREEDQVIPQPYVLNYDAAEKLLEAEKFYDPAHEGLFGADKILLQASQSPSWGRRVKAAIERRGYYASKNFWTVVPYPNRELSYHLTPEILVAILNWDVSNAWIIEHLKIPYISAYSLENISIPKHLSADDCAWLTSAGQMLEQEDASWGLPSLRSQDAQNVIDTVLKEAYQLDDEVFQRLRRVMQWKDQPLRTLDQQADLDKADWFVIGATDCVDAAKETITLWFNSFDDLQTVQIVPSMPGWLLRPDVPFETRIPRVYRHHRQIEPYTFDWGVFCPQAFMYMTEEELLEGIARQFTTEE